MLPAGEDFDSTRRRAESSGEWRLGLWQYDPATQVFTADDAVARQLGMSELRLRLDALLLKFAPADRVRAEVFFTNAVRFGEAEPTLLTVEKSSVEVERVLFRARPRRGAQGEIASLEGASSAERVAQSGRDSPSSRRRFASKILEAQEDERRRIAQDLHDALGQWLTSLSVQVRAIEEMTADQSIAAPLAKVRGMAEQAIAEVGRVVQMLRPAPLEDLGLVAAFQSELAAFEQTHNVKAYLHVDESWVDDVADSVELALYRIVQEALTNVAKHASASSVTVELYGSEETVTVVISDDGCGYEDRSDRGSDTRSFGIVGIKERADLLGGMMLMRPSDSGGTRIEVTVPARPSKKKKKSRKRPRRS